MADNEKGHESVARNEDHDRSLLGALASDPTKTKRLRVNADGSLVMAGLGGTMSITRDADNLITRIVMTDPAGGGVYWEWAFTRNTEGYLTQIIGPTQISITEV